MCRSCRQFNSGNHPDVYRITRENKQSIGVDQIRSMLESIQLKPYESARKVFIIEEAHTMTVQAQNALLKTLEEPPGFSVLILLAEKPQGLLPTVLSRCQLFRMQRLTKGEVCSVISRHFALPEDKAMLFASLSDGIPGKGLQLAGSKEFNDIRDEVLSFLEKIPGLSDTDRMGYRELFMKYKDKIDVIMDVMVLWFRDIVAYKEIRSHNFIVNIDKFSLLKEQSSLFTIKRLMNAIEKIEEGRRMLRGNANYQITIENLLLSL